MKNKIKSNTKAHLTIDAIAMAIIFSLIYLTGKVCSPLFVLFPAYLIFSVWQWQKLNITFIRSSSALYFVIFAAISLFSSKNLVFELTMLLSQFIIIFFVTNWLYKLVKVSATYKEKYHKSKSKLINAQKSISTLDHNHPLVMLVGGASHELKTPITSIMGFAEIALQKVIKENISKKELIEYLKIILQSADHSLIIIHDLLDFARSSQHQKQKYRELDINSCIENTIKIISRNIKDKQIALINNFSDQSPKIKGNYNQIRQVILNIMINARDAIGSDGKITISTHTQHNKVFIIIKDTGSGMSKNVLKNIFTPFYTTKEKKGTGLGLSVCKEIIEEHQGKITVSSIPDTGSEFKISLPLFTE